MDFTSFVRKEAIPALKWLGVRDWLEFGHSQSAAQRTIWTRPKKPTISPEEKKKYDQEHWAQVNYILSNANKDVANSFLALALSRSIAGGPKLFQPTVEDCEALENTQCSIAFNDYKQPYQVVIIEFPEEYKNKLAGLYKMKQGPSHAFVHYENNKFIAVHAFFDKNNVLSHITPARPEYKTIEDAITYNRRAEDNEVKVAELAQRLAVNFCMVMTLMGIKDQGPLDQKSYEKAKKLARSSNSEESRQGKKLLAATVNCITFIQKIKLYEEEVAAPTTIHEDGEGYHRSPKPHWRRGHYRNQRCGVQLTETRLVFIKPVLVRASVFAGDLSDTEVTYTLTNKEK